MKAEAFRKEIERDFQEAKATLLRADEADKKVAEKAKAARFEMMLENKATMDKRAAEKETEKQESKLPQSTTIF